MTNVSDGEQIARLLFDPQMIRDGDLLPSVFPMDELLTEKGKNGSSVDRCDYLKDKNSLLQKKAIEMSNSSKNRNPYGYCLGQVDRIRAIEIEQSQANGTNPKQALDVWPAPITQNVHPKDWDTAHALLKKFDNSYTRAHLRGARDQLMKIFSNEIVRFSTYIPETELT